MIDRIYLGVYWRDRKETAAECARRAAQLLAHIRQVDPALGQWFETGHSRKHALTLRVSADVEQLEKLFRRGVNRTDEPPRRIIPHLGFDIDIWNGGSDEEACGLSFSGGAYSAGRWFPNNCLLHLPDGGSAGQRLNRLEPILTLLQGMVKATEPFYGVAMTDEYQEAYFAKHEAAGTRPEAGQARVGWVTYFSTAADEIVATVQKALPHLPPPVRTEDGGVLLITTTERFDASNPAHAQAAEALEQVLRDADLLAPR